MVTDAILNAIYAVIVAVLELIPSVGFDWQSPAFGEWLQIANVFVPLSEAMALARAVLTVATGLVMVWAVLKVVDWLPFT